MTTASHFTLRSGKKKVREHRRSPLDRVNELRPCPLQSSLRHSQRPFALRNASRTTSGENSLDMAF